MEVFTKCMLQFWGGKKNKQIPYLADPLITITLHFEKGSFIRSVMKKTSLVKNSEKESKFIRQIDYRITKMAKEFLTSRMSEGATDSSSSNSLQNMQIITFTLIGLRLAYKRSLKKSLHSHSSISELNCKRIPKNWNSNN